VDSPDAEVNGPTVPTIVPEPMFKVAVTSLALLFTRGVNAWADVNVDARAIAMAAMLTH
jgi:hypothetical protein